MMNYPPALLYYEVTPTAVPYSVGTEVQKVTLMLSVNNPTKRHLDCSRIVFAIPPGTGNGDLTDDVSAITPTPALGVDWDITSDGAGNLTAVPAAGCTGIDAGDSIAFLVADIEVNGLPGLAEIGVYEQTDQLRYTDLGVSKTPPGLAITSFTANPVEVVPGASTTLSWTTTGAQTCTISWDGGTDSDLLVSGTQPVTPDGTTTYTLTASSDPEATDDQDDPNAGAPVIAQVTVYVPELTITSFSAQPTQILKGKDVTLTWEVENAQSCVITPGNLPASLPSGQLQVNPQADVTYELSATAYGKTVTMPSQAITVAPPPSFSDVAVSVQPNGAVVVQYAGMGGSVTVSVDGGPFQPSGLSGSVPLQAPGTTTLQGQGQDLASTVVVTVAAADSSLATTLGLTDQDGIAVPGTLATFDWSGNVVGVGVSHSGTVATDARDTSTLIDSPTGSSWFDVCVGSYLIQLSAADGSPMVSIGFATLDWTQTANPEERQP